MTAAATVATLDRTRKRRERPPEPPDRITQYALDVIAGRIVAGILVRKACERHLRDLADGPARGLTWDVKAGERAIDFFGLLRQYKGEWGPRRGAPQGDPLRLEAWQAFAIGSLFGWKRADGTRRFRRLYLEVAKKNGKTLLAAGIGILLAFFDDESGAEVYAAASKREQAKLVWGDALQMVRKNASLARRIQTLALTLLHPASASFFRPLGRDSDSDQGINPHGAIIDELHVLDDRGILDNISTAMGARRQPLLVLITTAGVERVSVWADERADAVAIIEGRATDDSVLALVYTLDEGDDPFDPAVWPKSNPNLGISVKESSLVEAAAKAQRSPGALTSFLRLQMNVPTAVSTRAISIAEWDANGAAPEIPDGAAVYAGLDLASVKDLTAFLLLHRDEAGIYHVLPRFFCPAEGIEERSRIDGVPYADWVRDGFLTATEGNVTDYEFVRAQILADAERYFIAEIAYDTWNALQLATELGSEGANMIAIRQTHAGLGPSWRELEKIILDHNLRHGGHPVLRWMAGNVEVETDAAGNQKPSKARSTERIDGMVALTMAVGRWVANGAPAVWSAA